MGPQITFVRLSTDPTKVYLEHAQVLLLLRDLESNIRRTPTITPAKIADTVAVLVDKLSKVP